MSAPPTASSLGFDATAGLVLDYLRENVPIAFWSVTRVANGRQTYLYLDADNGYGLSQGGSHDWQDSFCVHMAAGTAPAVAPDAQAVPLYAGAAVNDALPIGAYAGAVVSEPDGTLFGAICGLDPAVHTDDPAFARLAPLLQLLGRVLTLALAADRAHDEDLRATSRARVEADTDALTGLLNRRGWERAVADEARRFARYGDPTVVVMIDLDMLKTINDDQGHEAGDAYIRRAGQALSGAVRRHEVVARLGGDEFGLIMADCEDELADQRVTRLYEELAAVRVAGSVGWAPISVQRGFPAAMADADEAMYAAKQARRARRSAAAGAEGAAADHAQVPGSPRP